MTVGEAGIYGARNTFSELFKYSVRFVFRRFRVEVANDDGGGFLEHALGDHRVKKLFCSRCIFFSVFDKYDAAGEVGKRVVHR